MGASIATGGSSATPAEGGTPAATPAHADGSKQAAPAAPIVPAKTDAPADASYKAGDYKPGEKPAETKPAEAKAPEGKPAEKPADAKVLDAKPGEKPAEPKVGAPEKYELKAPEGVELKPEQTKAVEDLARKLDLPNDKAQALLEHQVAVEGQVVERMKGDLRASSEAWAKTVEADKDLGGANLDGTKIACKRFLDSFGDDELRKALDASGYGNWPPLVRAIAKAGKAMGEDRLVQPGGAANPSRRAEDVLYDAPIAK